MLGLASYASYASLGQITVGILACGATSKHHPYRSNNSQQLLKLTKGTTDGFISREIFRIIGVYKDFSEKEVFLRCRLARYHFRLVHIASDNIIFGRILNEPPVIL